MQSNGLMARLTALELKAFPAGDDDTLPSNHPLSKTPQQRVARIYFGLGLVSSAVAGFVALLIMLFAFPERTGTSAQAAPGGATRSAGRIAHIKPDPLLTRAVLGIDAPAAIEVAVWRSERAHAPFPLQVTGANDADGLRVVLRDVPSAALLSRGERTDEHTWSLRLADLDNLHMTLSDGTPEAFDVTIEVAAAGYLANRTIARVHLLDAPEQAGIIQASLVQPPVVPTFAPASTILALAPTPAHVAAVAVPTGADAQPAPRVVSGSRVPRPPRAVDTRAKAAPVVASAPVVEGAPPAPPHIQRPEGMSALGNPVREPRIEDRQVWWKLPVPGWSPFSDVPGTR